MSRMPFVLVVCLLACSGAAAQVSFQGKTGTMKNWKYEDGAKYLFPEADVKAARKE